MSLSWTECDCCGSRDEVEYGQHVGSATPFFGYFCGGCRSGECSGD